MSDRAQRARTMWSLLEPVHAVTYFSPEPLAALRDAGFRGFWMGYFAGRAAPLGAVGPDVVHALFYNFGPERVRSALPAAWEFGDPQAALTARESGSVAALRRLLAATDRPLDVARAGELLLAAADAAPLPGRPLFAANHALPVPADPLARLWHAATLLREHRGEGHLAALLCAGVGGRESHVLASVGRGIPRDVYRLARDFDEREWTDCLAGLASRDLVVGGELTDRGRALVAEIEERTDELAAPAYDVLDAQQQDELAELLEPIARAVVAGGEIPLDSPMGLDLRAVG